MMSDKKMLELEDSEVVVQRIYQANICSVQRLDINICFFFIYYKTFMGKYEFRITRAFPLHWKKHLSKKLIEDYLLTLEYSYWFSSNCGLDRLEERTFKDKVVEQFFLYSPININIREYDV